jgi:hypothetical protein
MGSGGLVSTGGRGGPAAHEQLHRGRWVEQRACARGLLDDDKYLDRSVGCEAVARLKPQISKESLRVFEIESDDAWRPIA